MHDRHEVCKLVTILLLSTSTSCVVVLHKHSLVVCCHYLMTLLHPWLYSFCPCWWQDEGGCFTIMVIFCLAVLYYHLVLAWFRRYASLQPVTGTA